MRGRLPSSASRASRRARSTRPRCARRVGSGPRCTARSCRRSWPRSSRCAEAASRCRVCTDRTALRDLAVEVEWAKVSNVRPDDYPEARALRPDAGRRRPGHGRAGLRGVRGREDRARADRPGGRAAVRGGRCSRRTSGVAEEVRRQYRTFVVDEYQDVSPLQQSLLDLWLGGREDVCVVGDPAQTIYSWAGADPDYLVAVRRRGIRRATVVELVRDYRSTPQVVAVANTVLDGPIRRARAGVRCGRSAMAGRRPFTGVLRTRSPRPTLWRGTIARPGRARDSAARDRRAVPDQRAVRELRAGAGRAKIPAVLKGAERFFERAEVRQAAVLLPWSGQGGDVIPTIWPRRSPACWVGPGWTPEPPAGTGAVETAGSRWPPGRDGLGRRFGRRPTAGWPICGRARAAGVDPARPGGRGRHAGHPARGQGAGVGLRLRRRGARGTLPISYAQTPAPGGGGAAAVLRRHHPGQGPADGRLVDARDPRGARPARPVPVPGPLGVGRRPGRAAPGPGSSGAAADAGRRGASAGSAARPARRRGAASSAAARTARPRWTRPCSSGCGRGGSSGRRSRRSRRTSCSPTPP